MELPFKCILTRSIFIISSSCWTLRYVSLLNKRLNVSEVILTARLDDPNGFQAKKSVFVLQSCRVHRAGEKMEEHAVIVTEGWSRLWRLWTVLLTPRDRFDHWTSATVRHSTPNCRVTTRPTIYQSRFSPWKTRRLSAPRWDAGERPPPFILRFHPVWKQLVH